MGKAGHSGFKMEFLSFVQNPQFMMSFDISLFFEKAKEGYIKAISQLILSNTDTNWEVRVYFANFIEIYEFI